MRDVKARMYIGKHGLVELILAGLGRIGLVLVIRIVIVSLVEDPRYRRLLRIITRLVRVEHCLHVGESARVVGKLGIGLFRQFGRLDQSNPKQFDASNHIVVLIRRYESVHPNEQRCRVDDEQNQIPKPQEREYLLVEQVDRQHTLHVVFVAEILDAELAHLKLAHGDAGKVFRVDIAFALQHVAENGRPVDVVVATQEHTYQEELAKTVDYVKHFDEQIKDDQVVAEELAKHETHEADEAAKQVHVAVGLLAPRVVHVLVYRAYHVLHHFAVLFYFAHAFKVMRGLDYVLDVHT